MQTSFRNRPGTNYTGIALLAFGVVLILAALFADRLDVGGGEGFGYQQLIALIMGIVFLLGGARLLANPWFIRSTGSDFADER